MISFRTTVFHNERIRRNTKPSSQRIVATSLNHEQKEECAEKVAATEHAVLNVPSAEGSMSCADARYAGFQECNTVLPCPPVQLWHPPADLLCQPVFARDPLISLFDMT